jgi:hypothetical protein
MQFYELITKLLNAFLSNTRSYARKNKDSKIIDIAYCKTYKERSLAAKYAILIQYCHPTAKPRTLCESTDGPAGRHVDYPPNSDRLGDFHSILPEFNAWAN